MLSKRVPHGSCFSQRHQATEKNSDFFAKISRFNYEKREFSRKIDHFHRKRGKCCMNADENEPRMNANAREWKRVLPARYALHFFALREKISNLKTQPRQKKRDFKPPGRSA